MNTTERLFDWLRESTSPYHCAAMGAKILAQAGFEELDRRDDWKLERGKGYYLTVGGTTLIGFYVNENMKAGDGFRIATAHTDWPGFRVKPSPEVVQGEYGKLNVEGYGGMILSTWLDRPLSLAGAVALKGEDVFHPRMKLVDFKRTLLSIPNLAIHMNRDMNKGVEYNRQTDMLPLVDLVEEKLKKTAFFTDFLAKEISCAPEDILDFDLCLYNRDQPELFGIHENLITSPRLDNVTSAAACVEALLHGRRGEGINLCALLDNEEIGSRSAMGANSMLLPSILEKICQGLSLGREAVLSGMAGGFLFSADVSHGVHPNHPEANDITNNHYLGQGVALKMSRSQSYATDPENIAVAEGLCRKYQIPFKRFVTRSDKPGGSTLGPILSSLLNMPAVDVGVPILAMHSARETCAAADQEALVRLLTCFFAE